MITTLRGDGERFFIDITVDKNGSVAQTIGPIQGKELAERWERYTLLRYRTWENILGWDIRHNFARQAMFDLALRKLVGETDEYTQVPFPAGHEKWMERHPLSVTVDASTSDWIKRQDPYTGMFNFSREEREHIRDGFYKDLNHCCHICLAIDEEVYKPSGQEARS